MSDQVAKRARRRAPARMRPRSGARTRRVLGIDLASSKWSSVGSATIEFDVESRQFARVVAGAIAWPAIPLTPAALAEAIDVFARREGIHAVALDGPQGFRDPATPDGMPGVGRRCEYECRTQGKTGVYPRTFPGTQRAWIEFCVQVFAALLAKHGVALAEPGRTHRSATYLVLECFPTSAWRSSALRPLPAKSKRPLLTPYVDALSSAYRLPTVSTREDLTHDDLQAVVAALTAVAAAGGPALPVVRGAPARVIAQTDGTPLRIEGYIWDVKPAG
jgi:Protein of unknown function (DUF429)